ncbi:hypothetical protein RvY_13222-2 [Ramazzottius varieornatus]|uniref:Transmembrane protein 14C n=1 Tax=Ramazzottius varieornatus TaxID=947166 RepID=A0A1D1VM68_RAMVA|nr:hypothetical protein RvY_13222-2 [Ramazzottius varieornatus]
MDILGFIFAAVVGFGGIFGYIRKKSHVSLAMGLIFSFLLAYGAYLVTLNAANTLLSTIVTGVIAAVFGKRYAVGWKFMPSGAMLLATLPMFAKYAYKLIV